MLQTSGWAWWWCTVPLIPEVGRQGQVDLCKFEVILVYIEFQGSQGYIGRHCLNNKIQ